MCNSIVECRRIVAIDLYVSAPSEKVFLKALAAWRSPLWIKE